MGNNTSISWCDMTFNPWIGCTKVGPACDGCYAEALFGDTGRFPRVEWGRPGHRSTHVRTAASTWAEPRRWDRMAVRDGVRRFVFCASVADVFDNQVPPEWRRDLFDLIRATPNLTWLLLTKRPQNIIRLFRETTDLPAPYAYDPEPALAQAWPRNAAIGCTVVTQAEADRDVPLLLRAKSALSPAFAFVSMEPLLGSVDLTALKRFPNGAADKEHIDALRGTFWTDQTGLPNPDPKWAKPGVPFNFDYDTFGGLDWVITGGETEQGEHKARPSHHEWLTGLRDQCAAAGVAFHHKQNGEWMPIRWMADGEADDLYHPAPKRDPEAIRRCKVDSTVMNRDGSLHPRASDPETYHAHHGSMLMFKVGVGRAGRELDGVVHDARPATPGLTIASAA